jgi:hypothetical protein
LDEDGDSASRVDFQAVEKVAAVEAEQAATLALLRQRMERAVPWTTSMLGVLKRDGFALTHVRNSAGPAWFVRVSPPRPLQEGFGLAPEVLIVAVDGGVQARTLHEASGEVVQSGLRLDGNLVIVADHDASTLADRLDRIGGHGQRIAWGAGQDGAWPSLTEVLRARLPGFDAFEERDAVRGAQLVGRDAEVASLRTRVVRGDAVGLFGLRKMGKTSVMRAVTDWFDPASGLREVFGNTGVTGAGVAVVVDASVLIERTVDAVADELCEALRRRMRVAGEEPPRGDHRGLAGWKAAGEALLDHDRRLCVVIDEYDLLFEGESGEGAIPGIGRIFRLLRGWAQTRQGYVSLILVGRDPTHLSAPEIDGVTSALTAWCTPMWLGPLDPLKAAELLRKLGRRVGLAVGPASVAIAQQWTGGHPLLHRQFGSALRSVTRMQDVKWGAPTDPIAQQAPSRFVEREAVLDVMREVVALLRKRYPSALDALVGLAHGAGWEDVLAERGGSNGDAGRTLRSFGLVSPANALAEGLASYLSHAIPMRKTA